ncbi:MAG: DNA mismatch repair protein MutS [Calditrichia bacterium]
MSAKSGAKSSKTTPMMEQYLEIKSRYQDMLLLYRMGDFYETFYEDAKTVSRVVGIALTKRAHGKSADVPLAGFPYHALDNYLPKLVDAGYRVAICEQVEDPKKAKTVVKRDVVEVVTPGTALSDKILDRNSNNYLAAVTVSGQVAGISYGDFSTGEFFLCELGIENLVNYLLEINPRELLVSRRQYDEIIPSLERRLPAIVTRIDDWIFSHKFAYETLTRHFATSTLKGFGAEGYELGTTSAGAILHYAGENVQDQLQHVRKLSVISPDEFMILDQSTRRNLEITSAISAETNEGTLLAVIDHTMTPMGGRLLRQLITHPLVRMAAIIERLEKVDAFYQDADLLQSAREHLRNIGDLERLYGRITTGRASPRDLITLRNALTHIEPLKKTLGDSTAEAIAAYVDGLADTGQVIEEISRAMVDEPPQTITDGGIIREGYNAELDELRSISREGKSWMVDLQTREKESSGIPSLKIGFNKVFGYYFEVTRAHQDKVPEHFIRKQTLVNAERYITPDLKEFEEKVLGAEERMSELEHRLFQELREQVAGYGETIQHNARLIAEIDALSGMANVAKENNYVKPEVNDSDVIDIVGGRHPVVEHLLGHDKPFIDNDTALQTSDTQIMLITGPNMSGKSTYLRQVGLITLMAQIGSFVPATKASIGIVDRIFTRVGASDNLAFGESTFMVEMLESANILNNATAHSLILLDEIGRGTSTYDGLSIAWALTEYLHHNKKVAARTLFATHYHELTELAMLYPRIKNFRVAVQEYEDHVVFLHKIEAGGMDNSYGIYVAQMAGLPIDVVRRAREVLHNLESSEREKNKPSRIKNSDSSALDKQQLSLFAPTSSVVENELQKIDLNNLTPIDALLKLRELKAHLKS